MPRRNTKKQAKASKSRHASKGSPMMDTVSSVAISPTLSAPELEEDQAVQGSQQQPVEMLPHVQDTPEGCVPPPTPQHVTAPEAPTIFYTCLSKSSGPLASRAATPVVALAATPGSGAAAHAASANASSVKTMSLVISSSASESSITLYACNLQSTVRGIKTVLADVGYAPYNLTTWVLCSDNKPLRDAARLCECGLPSLVTTLHAAMPADHQAPPGDAIRATSVAAITSITVTPARARPGASPGFSVIRHNIRVTLDPNVPITGGDGASPLPHDPVEAPAAPAFVPPRSSQQQPENESTTCVSTTSGATPTRSISQELEDAANTNTATVSDDGDHAVVVNNDNDDDDDDGASGVVQHQQPSCLKAMKERIKALKHHIARGGRFA